MTPSREDIFDQDRGEEALYQFAAATDEVLLPLTRLGFEAMLARISTLYNLPHDDASRSVIAGYVHHISNEQSTVTLKTLGSVLHKSVSNATTWKIDQEIKQKRKDAAAQAALEAKAKEESTLTLVDSSSAPSIQGT